MTKNYYVTQNLFVWLHGNQLAAVWEVHVLVTCATVACKYGPIIFIKYLFVKKKVKYILDQLQIVNIDTVNDGYKLFVQLYS
jgi:hypothetical protein